MKQAVRVVPDVPTSANAQRASRGPDGFSQHQRTALRYWSEGRTGAHAPHRNWLKPDRVRGILPVSSLIEPLTVGCDIGFRHLIEGSATQSIFGCAEGHSFDEVYAPEYGAQLTKLYRRVALGAAPDVARDTLIQDTGRAIEYTRLLLPFLDNAHRVVRILTVFAFEDHDHVSAPASVFGDNHAARVAEDAINPLRKPRFGGRRSTHVA